MTTQGFFTKLNQAAAANQSLLCLGLDPEVGKFASDFMPGHANEERLVAWPIFLSCWMPNAAILAARLRLTPGLFLRSTTPML